MHEGHQQKLLPVPLFSIDRCFEVKQRSWLHFYDRFSNAKLFVHFWQFLTQGLLKVDLTVIWLCTSITHLGSSGFRYGSKRQKSTKSCLLVKGHKPCTLKWLVQFQCIRIKLPTVETYRRLIINNMQHYLKSYVHVTYWCLNQYDRRFHTHARTPQSQTLCFSLLT